MLNLTELVILPVHNTYARQVVVTPIASQPGAPAYGNRGVYITSPVDIMTEAGVVFSDQKTMLRIRLAEYPIPPIVKDQIYIPPEANYPEVGSFEVQDVDEWASGGAMLTLRRLTVAP